MGNVPPISISNLHINIWTAEKKLLIWRTIAMSACIIGTAVYSRPLEPYLDAPIFGILVPTFITGYILINSSDILLLVLKKEYVFLETCFVVIGAIGSLICGTYQIYKWTEWIADFSIDPNRDYDVPELVLAFAFLFHFVALCAELIYRIFQIRESWNSPQANQ